MDTLIEQSLHRKITWQDTASELINAGDAIINLQW